MLMRLAWLIVIAILVMGCSQTTALNGGAGAQQEMEAVGDASPKQCSNFASGQEIFIAEQNGDLTTADKKSLDPNGDGYLCNEPGTQFKDTRTKVGGLTPFEVGFVVPGKVPDVKDGLVTVDVTTGGKKIPIDTLGQIGWVAVGQIDYKSALIDYRDDKTYKDIALGLYVEDQSAAEAMNRYVAKKGWKVEYFSGEVPPGGALEVVRW